MLKKIYKKSASFHVMYLVWFQSYPCSLLCLIAIAVAGAWLDYLLITERD